MGLVEEEWMETLATLDPEDITYVDFVSKGKQLCKDLKQKVALFKCKHITESFAINNILEMCHLLSPPIEVLEEGIHILSTRSSCLSVNSFIFSKSFTM